MQRQESEERISSDPPRECAAILHPLCVRSSLSGRFATLAPRVMKRTPLLFSTSCLLAAAGLPIALAQTSNLPDLATPQEKHLRNVRQLTFGGQNAEAYFSADGKKLIFQSTRDNLQCDQIFTMNVDGSNVRMVSNGKGRTTCGYFYPNGKTIL